MENPAQNPRFIIPFRINRRPPLTNLSIPGVHGAAVDAAVAALLNPYSIGIDSLAEVLGTMHAHQVDHADLFFQYARSEGWSLEEGIVKSGSFSIDQGV